MNEAIQYINQEFNEKRYSRHAIDGYIREAIDTNPDMQAKIEQGVTLVNTWMHGEYYESKMIRLAQLHNMDIQALVMDIFVGIAYCLRAELFTSVTAQLAGRLGFNDKVDAIKTVAELVTVLCYTDAYCISKEHKMASLMIKSLIPLSDQLIDYIDHSQYLPPMVCVPNEITSNRTSGYLNHNDSVILGPNNHHESDVCLDVLNIVNKVALKLDLDFLCTVEENPTFALDTPIKSEQWTRYKKQSYRFYDLMQSQGNRFYLTNKYDKRGRLYAQGYHISTMGTAFKKAMIEFADEELVTGVPNV